MLADMGLAITSDWIFVQEIASYAFGRLLFDWALLLIDRLWAVFPSGRLVSANARQFRYLCGADHAREPDRTSIAE